MILAMAVATVTAAGCGSDKKNTCNDACNAVFACATKLNATPPFDSVTACVTGCNVAACTDKQATIDCITAVQCTNIAAVEAAITQCETTYCP
jgi:hypothetical protein